MPKPSKTRGKALEGQGRVLAHIGRGQSAGAVMGNAEKLEASKEAARRLIAGRKEITLSERQRRGQSTDHAN